MTKAEKLFLYVFSGFTEAYGGMEALKLTDNILKEPDEVSWHRLDMAVQQQHRVKNFDTDKILETFSEDIRTPVQRVMDKLL